MDTKYDTYSEYILPCAINIPSEDDIVIDFVTNVSMVYLFIYLCDMCLIISNLTLFQTDSVNLYWVCLYSEEKLDTMERNLEIETSTGVKMIDHRQYRYPDNTHVIY